MTAIALVLALGTTPALAQISVDLGGSSDTDIGVSAGDTSVTAGTSTDASGNLEAGKNGLTIDLMTGAMVDTTVASSDENAVTLLPDDASLDAAGNVSSQTDVKLLLKSHVADSSSPVYDIFNKAGADASLKSKIEANATLVAALDDRGFEASDVVALRSTVDGDVVLFVDDLS
jgi:hypothetical protein